MNEVRDLEAVFYFHNVGQGGFYSGFIKNDDHDFNFVYDCGTFSGHKFLTDAISEIDGSMYSEQKLDLLVLSHLDADHVNGVSDLLTMDCIRRINILVMPYMTLLDRTILLSFYAKRKYDDSANYIDKKKRYFQNNVNAFPNSVAVIGTNDKWTMRELQTNQERCLMMLQEAYS